jgi:hypothetical protein
MNERVYKVSELKRVIKESALEMKAKKGNNVDVDNKKNNEKAYKDSAKRAEDYNKTDDNDKVYPEKYDKDIFEFDDNLGMQNIRTTYEVGDDFKEKFDAQAHGYPSVEAEKLHKNEETGNADFSGNEKIYKSMKKNNDDVIKRKIAQQKSGLSAREYPDSYFDRNNQSIFSNDKIKENNEQNKTKMKKLYFKHTKFLTENHMLTRIPEEFKVEGNKFIMKDAADNEYLIEWTDSNANVISHTNKTQLNEEMNKIKHLFNYKSEEYFTTTNASSRLNENKGLGNFIKKVKDLDKNTAN